MFVKICGVTTVDDALLAAGLGADAIGLNFVDSSVRRIDHDVAREIVDRVPPEVLLVGIFRNHPPERVVEVATGLGLGAVQLHGDESPDATRWIGERVPAVIKVFAIDDPALLTNGDYGPHHLMVDSPRPGSGETFDWGLIGRRVGARPFLLAGGLDPDNVATAIEELGPRGVDVATGVEASPGRKDPAKVRRFLAAARTAVPRHAPTKRPGSFFDHASEPLEREEQPR